MIKKKLKEFMIPASEYPSVSVDATMKDAVCALKTANEKAGESTQPYRAVLVTDKNNKVVGKIGQIAFLKALEPKYRQFFDMEKLTHSSGKFLENLMDNFNLWIDESDNISEIAKSVKVKEIMKPVEEHIDMNESITAAVHKIIMWQTLSLLVTNGKEIVGILRLSDLYSEIESIICDDLEK